MMHSSMNRTLKLTVLCKMWIADPIAFKVDNAKIQSNIGTVNGRARPAVTDHFKEDFLKAPDGTERGEMLNQVGAVLDTSFDVVW